jgi:spoIIIJ-associated protein
MTDADDGWVEGDSELDAESELDDAPDSEEAAGDDGAEAADADSGNGRAEDGSNERRRSRASGSSPDSRDRDVADADERTRAAMDFVTSVVREMDMDCRVRLRRSREGDADDEINIEISGRDAGRIIGKKGQVLQALQFLVHRVVNRPGQDRRHILVDAEGYRSRRDDSLASMAKRLGKQAVQEGKIITFEPMNPRDRRVVHLALAKFEGVITKSDGEGSSRRVQIIPVRR